MASPELQWISLPDDRVEVLGLSWFPEDFPETSRLPKEAMDGLPAGVRAQARFPAEGRLLLQTAAFRLHLRMQRISGSPSDVDGFSVDRFHPGDLGYALIAERLAPVFRCLLDS